MVDKDKLFGKLFNFFIYSTFFWGFLGCILFSVQIYQEASCTSYMDCASIMVSLSLMFSFISALIIFGLFIMDEEEGEE